MYDKSLSNLREAHDSIKEQVESVYDIDEFENKNYLGDRIIGFSQQDAARRDYLVNV